MQSISSEPDNIIMCLARKEYLRAYKYTRIKETKQKALKNTQTALLGLGPIINTVTDL